MDQKHGSADAGEAPMKHPRRGRAQGQMKVYLAHWYDVKDRMYRIAGIYRTERAANKRLKQLDCGTTQTLTLGQPVRFTHEKPKRRAKRESEK